MIRSVKRLPGAAWVPAVDSLVAAGTTVAGAGSRQEQVLAAGAGPGQGGAVIKVSSTDRTSRQQPKNGRI